MNRMDGPKRFKTQAKSQPEATTRTEKNKVKDVPLENIHPKIEDNYACNLAEYFGLFTVVFPTSTIYMGNVEKYYVNPNCVLLVIESMCIGILMNLQIANRFAYIKNCIAHNDYTCIFDGGMKIVKVTNKWNTTKWSFVKLQKFYDTLYLIENENCDNLEIAMLRPFMESYLKPSYDIEFLKSLGWNNDIL